jgi:universal stress protein E
MTRPGPRGLRRVLVPVDFSAGAERALDRAAALELAPAAELRLLHALPLELRGEALALARRGAQGELDARVARAAEALAARDRADVTVTSRVTRGRSHEAIGAAAGDLRAELIVIGRAGHQRRGGHGLGSTAGKVLRSAPVPLLLVARPATGPYRRAVAGVDLSPTCRKALHTLMRILPEKARVQVTVVHVDETPFEHALVLGGATAREIQRYRRNHADHMSRELERFLRDFAPDSDQWRLVRRTGDPRQHLLHLARPGKSDIVALGTHGRSGLARALLGSVAESVTRAAAVDALVAGVSTSP